MMKKPISPRRKRTFLLLLVAVVFAAVWALFFRGDDAKNNVPTAQVTRKTIEETVTAQGKLEPKEYVDVGAQVSGQLLRVHFEVGDFVKKGKLLAEIDPKIYEAQVEVNQARTKSLNAQIEQQRAQLVLAEQIFKRNTALIKSKAVSKEALQTSEANYNAAVANVASLKAQAEEAASSLKGALANLHYTKIYAPMDGTITVQTTRLGQTINSNQTAPNLMQIANLDIMTVRAQVAEADVSRIHAGMDVYFTTLGAGERRWQGQVRQVLPSPVTVNDVVLYEALVDVDNQSRELMTGMSTQMFFVIGQAENALVIPYTALKKPVPAQNTEAGKAYEVEVQQKNKTETHVVITGMTTRTDAEILSGLKEGDVVTLSPSTAEKPAPGTAGPGRRAAMGPRL